MRRRRWMVLAAVPLLMLLAHFAYWRLLQRQLAAGFAAWETSARAAGWAVDAGTGAGGGWPLSAQLTLTNFVLAGGKVTVPGGLAWRSPQVRLSVALLDPHQIDVDAQGRQQVRLSDWPEFTAVAQRLHATIALGGDGAPRAVDVLVDHLSADLVSGRGADGRLTLGLMAAHTDLIPEAGANGVGFSASAEAVDLPAMVRWPLGPRVSSVAVEGVMSGTLGDGITDAERAGAWRDSGGSAEIRRLALGWGPLGVSATATLALDDQLQPMGAGTARLVGYAEALDALAANGTLSRSAVTAAKAVLSLLAPTPGDGEAAEVEVPLTLQYRTLSMRQVPLVRLPELDWQQP